MKISHIISENDLLGKQKYQTGRAAQVKGKGPLPKKEPGRTKHPFHGKLVGEREVAVNEIAPALAWLGPIVISALRVGGPKLLQGIGRIILRNPGKFGISAGVIYTYETIMDMFPDIDPETLQTLKDYGLPAIAVLGMIYAGKKIYNWLSSKETESIAETATAGGTSAGGIASTGTGFASGGIGDKPKKKKKTNLIRR